MRGVRDGSERAICNEAEERCASPRVARMLFEQCLCQLGTGRQGPSSTGWVPDQKECLGTYMPNHLRQPPAFPPLPHTVHSATGASA